MCMSPVKPAPIVTQAPSVTPDAKSPDGGAGGLGAAQDVRKRAAAALGGSSTIATSGLGLGTNVATTSTNRSLLG